MSDIVVFGTGSFAELALFYFTHDSEHSVVGFTETESHLRSAEFHGLPVVPFERVKETFPPESYGMFVAVGYTKVNQVRARVYGQAKELGYELATYVSSKCTHWGDIDLGDNCFIFEGNNLQPYVVIGNDVIMWSGNHIGHHSSIGDHCFLTSHVVISGHVRVEPLCFFGVNATIRDDIAIASSNVIGANALIMKSTKPKEVYVAERTPVFRRDSDQIGL